MKITFSAFTSPPLSSSRALPKSAPPAMAIEADHAGSSRSSIGSEPAPTGVGGPWTKAHANV